MSKSGFCWADEVEKEEAEESRIRVREQKKPNPFGSARPREVVLQEKGIDWRKLDEELHQPSFPRKENNGPEQSIKPVEWGDGIGSPLNQEPTDSLVPPLRYPPKNIMTLLKENQWPNIVMPKGVNTTSPRGRRFIDVEEEIRGMRREREWGDMDFEYSRERFSGGRNDVRERARRRSPSVNGERIGYHHMYNEACSGEYFRDVGVRPLYDCGRQGFDQRKLERPHLGRRAQFRQDAYMEGGFGVNKRRGIEFGSNNSRDYQRRRKGYERM